MPGIFLTTNIFAHVGGLFFVALFPILVDALRGTFNARVRGGCRRARSPHANVLCEHLHASKADATNVARMSGGRAISRERPERVPKALAPGAQAQ